MGKRCRVLRAPDPRLLSELIPEDVFRKITQQRLCFVVDDDGTISDSNPMYIEWLARELKRPPRAVAEELARRVAPDPEVFAGVEVAGNPGFMHMEQR